MSVAALDDAPSTVINTTVDNPVSTLIPVNVQDLAKATGFFKYAIKPEWAVSRKVPDIIDATDHNTEDVEPYLH